MDAKQLRKMTKDKSISDSKVFKALNDFLADKKDASGNIIAPTEKEMKDIENLSRLIQKWRPTVIKKMARHVILQHKNCCCKP